MVWAYRCDGWFGVLLWVELSFLWVCKRRREFYLPVLKLLLLLWPCRMDFLRIVHRLLWQCLSFYIRLVSTFLTVRHVTLDYSLYSFILNLRLRLVLIHFYATSIQGQVLISKFNFPILIRWYMLISSSWTHFQSSILRLIFKSSLRRSLFCVSSLVS